MKHSPRDIDAESDSLLLPAPKRKGGNWLSGLRVGIEFVEWPFVRINEGRSKTDFRRLQERLAVDLWQCLTPAYSKACVGLGASTKSGRGGDDCIGITSSGVLTGVGD
jgi:hypothetical protein